MQANLQWGRPDMIWAIPLITGKCLISCLGAVHAEYFLQQGGSTRMPLAVTQVHFKLATAAGAILMGYCQGRRGGRIMADAWRGDLFVQLPAGVRAGDARMPFFGGWNAQTVMLVSCLVANNFFVGDQLRRLSSVAKYIAYAFGLALTHVFQFIAASSKGDWHQILCCSGIVTLAIFYLQLPGPRASTDEERKQK